MQNQFVYMLVLPWHDAYCEVVPLTGDHHKPETISCDAVKGEDEVTS